MKHDSCVYDIENSLAVQNISMHEVLTKSAEYLSACGIEDAQNDAWLLMEFVTGISRARYLIERQKPMNGEAKERYKDLLRKRVAHIPLQHLTGEQEFMGLSFLVNEHVLIPRQDTETLVEEALKYIRPGMHILDMCTGSGCIAISLKLLGEGKYMAGTIRADGVDLSEKALEVAQKNGKRLKADIHWIHSDLFTNVTDRYDMIVSNPPYIQTAVIEELSEEVRLHEPMQALDGKEDGLYFYRIITDQGRDYLKENGWLLFEIGYDQGEAVKDLMETNGFQNVKILQDLAGKDRVVYGQKIAG